MDAGAASSLAESRSLLFFTSNLARNVLKGLCEVSRSAARSSNKIVLKLQRQRQLAMEASAESSRRLQLDADSFTQTAGPQAAQRPVGSESEQADGILQLVALVRDGATAGEREKAAGALWNLAVNDDNKVAIAAAGGSRR